MKQIFILVLFLNVSLFSMAQKGELRGRIINPFNEYQIPYRIIAISLTDSTYYEWKTDSIGFFQGVDINYDTYRFYISHKMRDAEIINSITFDSTMVIWEYTIPNCKTVNENGVCNICNNSEFVIKLDPNSFRDTWFKTKKDEKKYYKEQKNIGYSIEDNMLVWIQDSTQNEKFHNPCNHWFCTKHLVIF